MSVGYSVQIKDNSQAWLRSQEVRLQKGLRRMGMDIVKNVQSNITPRKTRDLRDSAHIEGMGNTIKVVVGNASVRYAAAQEVGQTHGYPIRRYTTPGTGPHYLKKNGNMIAKRGLKRYV